MQMVLFCGVQATGKTTFYLERFFRTHVRISLDLLRTRNRERILLAACLAARQPFVVDNTNVTCRGRAMYIGAARAAGFSAIGYYFDSALADALARNRARPEDQRIPDGGVVGMYGRLEVPSRAEGFDQLYLVRVRAGGGFEVEEWAEEGEARPPEHPR